MRHYIGAAAALLCFFMSGVATAQEFVPGRPGNTESAIAVPEGRWQLETEIASLAEGEGGSDSWSALQTTFRYGIARGWDAEAIVTPYVSADDEHGFGDVTLRARKTLEGLDGGSSLGFIGYVTLPTAEDGLGADEVEGGIIAAGSFDLNDAWSLTWTGALGAVSNGNDYDASVSGGVSFGYAMTERAGAYVEVFAEHVEDETAATLDIGATYLTGPETHLDAGVDIGLTDAADDARIFIGWANRF